MSGSPADAGRAMTGRTTTAPPEPPLGAVRRARAGRRAFIAGLAVVIGAGLAGWLGPSSATVSERRSGYVTELSYPRIVRPGLAIQWRLEVTHPGGFDGPIRVVQDRDYFELFDYNVLHPEPGATAAGGTVVWDFDAPEGDTFRLLLDARTEPGAQIGDEAALAVYVGSRPVAEVDYRTWVMP